MAHWIADGALVAILLLGAGWDVATGRIPNRLTYASLLAGLVFWTVAGGIGAVDGNAGLAPAARSLGWSAASFGIVFVPMLIIWLMNGLRGGDFKLACAAGAWLGQPMTAVYAFLYACVAGGLLAVVVMIRRRVAMRTLSRVWRFLWLTSLGARPGSPTDASSPRVPWAVALLIGCLWAMAERRLDTTLFDVLMGR